MISSSAVQLRPRLLHSLLQAGQGPAQSGLHRLQDQQLLHRAWAEVILALWASWKTIQLVLLSDGGGWAGTVQPPQLYNQGV